jgi:hypothetical protein
LKLIKKGGFDGVAGWDMPVYIDFPKAVARAEIWEIIEKSKPPFLEEEMKMSEETCGVKPEPKPKDMYITAKGEYRITWCVNIAMRNERNGIPRRLRRGEGD